MVLHYNFKMERDLKRAFYHNVILFFTAIFFLRFDATAEELERVSLQLQWKHQFEFAGFYAAKAKGYYEAEGLDVSFFEYQNGMDIVDSVLNGTHQYGVTYSSLINEYLQGKEVLFVANFFKQSPLVLVTQKDIISPAMLKGRTVMGISDAIDQITLSMMLSKFGVTPDTIKTVPASFNVQDFIDKKVDAMSVYTTNELYELEKSGVSFNLFDPMVYGMRFYDLNLFTSQQELKEHPDRVMRFRRASIRGWEYALDHQEEIVDLILSQYNTLQKSREALLFEARQIQQLMLRKVYPVGSIDPVRVAAIAESFTEMEHSTSAASRPLERLLFQSENETMTLTPEELQYLQEKKVITTCVDPDWMPFESLKHGKYIGMSAEYMNLISEKLKIPIRALQTDSWSASIAAAKARKCDIFSLAMKTPERETYMNFTQPYLRVPLVIATTTDKLFVSEIKDVLDEKLGVVKEYAYAEILRLEYPQIHLVEYDNVYEGLHAVDEGEIFGFIDNLSVIAYQLQKNYGASLKITGRIDKDWELGIGVRNDDVMLLHILQKAIESIDDKTNQSIMNAWVSVTYEKGIDYSLIWSILAISGVIFLLMYYRFRKEKIVNTELQILSTTDPLTQLYNRRYLNEMIRKEEARAKRYGSTFSLILLDIDHFKTINDTHGHDRGDRVLVAIAANLTSASRASDIVGRWGGEEFMILCPNTTFEGAYQLAEKIRLLIANGTFAGAIRVTASLGVIAYHKDRNIDWHIIGVDKALYNAKKNGRNRVETEA